MSVTVAESIITPTSRTADVVGETLMSPTVMPRAPGIRLVFFELKESRILSVLPSLLTDLVETSLDSTHNETDQPQVAGNMKLRIISVNDVLQARRAIMFSSEAMYNENKTDPRTETWGTL